MNVPYWHLIHRATVRTLTGQTVQANGARTPTYTDTSDVPCRIQDDSSSRGLEQQRLAGSLFSTGYFPMTHNGAALTLDKTTLIVATISGVTRTYRVLPGRNAAGAGVLQVVGLEAMT